MTPERWDRVKALFHATLEVAEQDRRTFLEEHSGTDLELRQEVAALLGQYSQIEPTLFDGTTPANPNSRIALDAGESAEDFGSRLPAASVSDRPACSALAPEQGEETVSIADAALTPTMPQLKVHAFGDYELLAEIAHGGMGVVYKARQISLNRPVALKMILAGQFASDAEVKRFQAEACAAATLDHRHIVAIYEIGHHNGQHYFTMPYIEGKNLARMEGRWRTGDAAAKLVAKIARAVQYAHERGILHRDLKPANILIDVAGEPHILDFGLARHIGTDSSLTLEGAVLGTPSFMAPEQAAGKTANLGATADIYGLGAILYFLLTGRPPFNAASPLDTLVQVLEGEVVVPRLINPRVGPDLERICLRCLEKSPERRYPDAESLAADLERFVRHEPVKARPPGFMPFLLHWLRHQPALVTRLAGLAICLITAQLTHAFDGSRTTPLQHRGIVATLGIWGVLSIVCQWAMQRERGSKVVPFVWVMLDFVCLTIILRLDETLPTESFPADNAVPGPLLGSYLVLIVLSGLWFRLPLVGFATLLAVLAYNYLIMDLLVQCGSMHNWNWHLVFLLFLVVAGSAVAYQVHRVRALSRFYDRRL